jgi:predicted MFS family arabinose efflux permease
MILAAIFTAPFAMAITQFTKRWDRKPFNCELCMTFWISLIVSVLSFSYLLDAVMFIGIAVTTRQILWKKWRTMF